MIWRNWNQADKTLLFVLVVFLFCLCLHLSYPASLLADGLLFCAEAALVGGLADWFAVTALFEKETGKQVDLPYGLEAVRSYTGVCLRTGQRNQESVSCDRSTEEGDALGSGVGNTGKKLVVARHVYRVGEDIPAGEDRKLIDAAAVKGTPVLRTPRPGDRIVIDASGGSKALNRFFTDQKIPREERTKWPVVADDEKILWVVGLRLSACCKVTEKTGEVYLLRIEDL